MIIRNRKLYSALPDAARTEPREAIVRAEPCADLREHLAAIVAEFRDRRVPVTPLNVMSRALDTGLGEATAVQLAGMIEHDRAAA